MLLANHPVMVPDAIRRLVAEQKDMELVADCRGPMKILQETGRTKADAVILTQEGQNEPGLCSQLLAVYPDLTIFSVDPKLVSTSMQQLRAHRRTIAIGNEQQLVRALRVAVREPCGEKQP